MNSRRAFLVSVPVLAFSAGSANAQKILDCANSAKSVEKLKNALRLPATWIEEEFDGCKFLFALMESPTDGTSHIDLHGWVYNEHFQEWRRFLEIKTRNLGGAKLDFDNGIVSIRGATNNEFNGVEVFSFDLRVTSSDVAYKKK